MNLLALVESAEHVCCRYRIRAFAPALHQAGWALTCEGLERGVVPRVMQLRRAERFDAVILQRKLLPGWQLGDPPPVGAPARLRLRRRGPVPRLERPARAGRIAGVADDSPP